MAELRLLVLHYHLWPGGVASVIRQGLSALARYGSHDTISVRLLTGSERGVRRMIRWLQEVGAGRIEVDGEVHPLLGYRNRSDLSMSSFHSEKEKIRQIIESAIESHQPDAVWAHNPTLGKNPALTAVLSQLSVEGRTLFLYHLHDFAECGRYDNLAFLRRSIPGDFPLYPVSPSTKMITLTRSDRDRLLRAGYPASGVHRLPNPVCLEKDPVMLSGEERQVVDRAIRDWAERQGFSFEAGGKWLFAPIRTIRRKNVLELALLQRLLGEPWRLLVTLGSNSEPERPYADLAIEALKRSGCPAAVGFGGAIPCPEAGFDRLYASADLIGSTSVLEGFGLVFAESALYGRPLIGRDLPDVTGEMTAGLDRTGLYRSLSVPLERFEFDRLLNAYREKIETSFRLAGLEEEIRDRAMEGIERRLSASWVDFSWLDVPAQIRTLQSMQSPAMQEAVRKANPDMEKILQKGCNPPSEAQRKQIQAGLGPECFARRFERILESGAQQDSESAGDVSRGLAREFFQPPFLRLLLSAGDEWRCWTTRLLPRYVEGASVEPSSKKRPDARPVVRSHGIRAVLWDVYGTLLLSTLGDLEQRLAGRAEAGAFLETFGAVGLNPSRPVKDPAQEFGKIIESDHDDGKREGRIQPEVCIVQVWQRLAERVFPGQWLSLDQARYAAALYELKTNPVALNAGAVEAIRTIHRQGILQGILSNAQFYTAEILKHVLGKTTWSLLEPSLQLWSFEIGAAKPDPAIFFRAAEALGEKGVRPEQIVLIGDSVENDMVPAGRQGWKTIHLSSGDGPASGADYSCSHLKQAVEWLVVQDVE